MVVHVVVVRHLIRLFLGFSLLWWVFRFPMARAMIRLVVIGVVAAIWNRVLVLVLADLLLVRQLLVAVVAAPGVLVEKPLLLMLSLVLERDPGFFDWVRLLLLVRVVVVRSLAWVLLVVVRVSGLLLWILLLVEASEILA